MKRILSFGGGLQTTAMAILVEQGKLDIDEAVFADTGCEKPETYWYMDSYIKPLFAKLHIPFITLPAENGGLIGYCNKYRIVPSVVHRWCTRIFKSKRLNEYALDNQQLIGFSVEESRRAENPLLVGKLFPLIEMGLSGADCHDIIANYGFPIPLKSSCYICPFQRWSEWNWIKWHHPELLQKAIDIEKQLHKRRPQDRERAGLFGGKPLWKFVEGKQYEFGFPEEYSCWSGYCSH